MPDVVLSLRPSVQEKASRTSWSRQTCLAPQEARYGWVKAFPSGLAMRLCDLWVTSLHLCCLSCRMRLVGLAHHPGCWGEVS